MAADSGGKSKTGLVVTSTLVGFVVGVVAGVFAPGLLGPSFPGVGSDEALVTGIVRAKQREGDRLLLTVQSSEGATLATFRERIEEITLLVDVGDTLTFELRRYAPFIEDPRIAGVKKTGEAPPARLGADSLEGGPMPADTTPPTFQTDSMVDG